MAAQKPILSERVLDSEGRPQSLAVTIRNKDGTAFTGTLYDSTTGAVVTNPVTSNNLGLLEVFGNRPQRVQMRAGTSAPWVTVSFDPDPETMPLYLDDFAGALPINTGVNSAYAALQSAIAVAQVSGQTIQVGVGSYLLGAMTTLPSNVTIRGAGKASVFKHADNYNGALFFFSPSTVASRFASFKIDGNYANNSNDVTGCSAGEIYIYGTDCMLEDVLVTNFNAFGFVRAGTRNRYIRCRAEGVAVTTPGIVYAPTTSGGGTVQHYNYASIHGFFAPGTNYCDGEYMEDCSVNGTRATGMYLGGVNGYCLRPKVENCHRGYWPDDGTGIFPGSSGGGQLAFALMADANGTPLNTAPANYVVENPDIGASSGPAAGGIEIGASETLTIMNPFVTGAGVFGIKAFTADPTYPCSNLSIFSGRIANINTSATDAGIGCADVVNFTMDGTNFQTCRTAIVIQGTSDYLTLVNLGMYANTANFSMTATPTVFTSHSHRERSGTALPVRINGTVTLIGGQLAFPATQNASSNANTLDDYEEGVFTPSIGGTATYNVNNGGTYTKVGRMVTAWGRLDVLLRGTGSQSVISGLPFASDQNSSGAVDLWANAAASYVFLTVRADIGASVTVLGITAAGATTAAVNAITDNTIIRYCVTYRTAN